MGKSATGPWAMWKRTTSWWPTPGAARTEESSAHGKWMTMESDDTKRFSLESLREQRDQGKTETHADAPARLVDPNFWDTAQVVMPSQGKTSVHLRVDADVLHWFKSRGRGHLTRM